LILRRTFFIIGVVIKHLIAILVGVSVSSLAQANFKFVESGATYSALVGELAPRLTGQFGWNALVGYSTPSVHKNLAWLGNVRYQGYPANGAAGIAVQSVQAMLGASVWGENGPLRLKPFVNVLIGGSFLWLTLPQPVAVMNNSIHFAAEVAPGLEIPIYSGLGITWQMPFGVIVHNPLLLYLQQVLSVRWTF
jgi:hypothetical protein